MGGAWGFRGTRVPMETLTDMLAAGYPLDEVLDDVPTLDRADCVEFLHTIGDAYRREER